MTKSSLNFCAGAAQLDYATWQQEYFYTRLRLAVPLIALAMVFLSMMNISLYPQPMDTRVWLVNNFIQILAIFFGVILIYFPKVRQYPAIAFLWFSWTLTLIPQYQQVHQIGIIYFDILTWTVVFLGQAALLPLRWWLHAVSQWGVITTFFILHLLFDIYPQVRLGEYLYFFSMCILIDVFCYRYEALQYGRFELHEKLEQEARFDELTGVLNCHHFQERLEAAIQYARRFKHPVSICLCRIDHFAYLEETYGKEISRRALVEFARIIRLELRIVDLAGRFGEEFCILFSGTHAHDGVNCVRRIRQRLAEIKFNAQGQEFTVTATFATAEWSNDYMTTKEDLLEAADEAFSRATALGPDQVMIYHHIT